MSHVITMVAVKTHFRSYFWTINEVDSLHQDRLDRALYLHRASAQVLPQADGLQLLEAPSWHKLPWLQITEGRIWQTTYSFPSQFIGQKKSSEFYFAFIMQTPSQFIFCPLKMESEPFPNLKFPEILDFLLCLLVILAQWSIIFWVISFLQFLANGKQ